MVVKNVKVINSSKLNTDGTFEIGLRDALLINKNSKVVLDKFVYRQVSSANSTFKKPKDLIKISFTADALGTRVLSTPTEPKSFIMVTDGIKTVNDFLRVLDEYFAHNLTAGPANHEKWEDWQNYLEQVPGMPTLDVGLDIWSYIDTKTNNIIISINSYNPTRLLDEDSSASIQGIEIAEPDPFDNKHVFAPKGTVNNWYAAGSYAIVKSAFQLYVEIDSIGAGDLPYDIGVRNWNYRNYNEAIPIPVAGAGNGSISWGVRVSSNKYYYINLAKDIEEDRIVPFKIGGLNVETGDKIFMYSGGNMNEDIRITDSLNIIIFDINGAKKASIHERGTSIFLGDHNLKYRPFIGNSVGVDDNRTGFPPVFNNFRCTVTNPNFLNLPRVFKLDLSEAGSLSNELGFSSSIIETEYSAESFIIGQQSPSFYAIQDISIYWSLPMLSFIASADKKRNAREKLIATFTPTRAVDRFDSLVYNSSLPYVSIGNNEQLNISSLSFRVLNEYTGEALNSAYLSFNLLIKDENE